MSAGAERAAVVVVGASAAGLSTAEALRREGHTGRLTLIGDEPHQPYDRPPLSKHLLSGEWEAERLALRTADALEGLGLDLRLGTPATGVDLEARRVRLGDGTSVGFDALVIATGATARRLPGTDGVPGVHALRTLEDALTLRAALAETPRLAIVGAGFVGAEAAAVARTAGCEVTLISDTGEPLADALGADLGSLLAREHREHGVRVEAGARVEAVVTDGAGRAAGVRLADGRTVDADAVLVGIGAVPATGWLADSGIPLGDGVLCDAALRAAPGVWAAGDVARWPHPVTGLSTRIEHRTNASEQGLAVARNILADQPRPFAPVPYVWSDQYDLRIQVYGTTRGADRVRVVEGDPAGRRLVVRYGKDGKVVGAAGVNMARALRAQRAAVAAAAPWEQEAAAVGG